MFGFIPPFRPMDAMEYIWDSLKYGFKMINPHITG